VYNRYIPEDASYSRVEETAPPPKAQRSPEPARRPRQNSFQLPDILSGKEGLSGLLKTLRLDRIDSGDILLLLIMLYLMKEGDDMDLVIALGLTLIMGLGDDSKGE